MLALFIVSANQFTFFAHSFRVVCHGKILPFDVQFALLCDYLKSILHMKTRGRPRNKNSIIVSYINEIVINRSTTD